MAHYLWFIRHGTSLRIGLTPGTFFSASTLGFQSQNLRRRQCSSWGRSAWASCWHLFVLTPQHLLGQIHKLQIHPPLPFPLRLVLLEQRIVHSGPDARYISTPLPCARSAVWSSFSPWSFSLLQYPKTNVRPTVRDSPSSPPFFSLLVVFALASYSPILLSSG